MKLHNDARILFGAWAITQCVIEQCICRWQRDKILSELRTDHDLPAYTAIKALLSHGAPISIIPDEHAGPLSLRTIFKTFPSPHGSPSESSRFLSVRLIPETGSIRSIELHEEPFFPSHATIVCHESDFLVLDLNGGNHRLELLFHPHSRILAELQPPTSYQDPASLNNGSFFYLQSRAYLFLYKQYPHVIKNQKRRAPFLVWARPTWPAQQSHNPRQANEGGRFCLVINDRFSASPTGEYVCEPVIKS